MRCHNQYTAAIIHKKEKRKIKFKKQEIKLRQEGDQHSALCDNTRRMSLSDHSQLSVYVCFRCVKAISYRPSKPQYPHWNLTHT